MIFLAAVVSMVLLFVVAICNVLLLMVLLVFPHVSVGGFAEVVTVWLLPVFVVFFEVLKLLLLLCCLLLLI